MNTENQSFNLARRVIWAAFIFFTMIIVLADSVAAQSTVEEDFYNQAYGALMEEKDKGLNKPLPDVFSPSNVPLSPSEKKALSMSQEWAKNPVEPIILGNGKVVYMYGATIPTIISAPFQICDLELQAGEKVQEIILGDSARWQVEVVTAGSGRDATPHLIVKPQDTGLETSAVITSDKRIYHLRLVSQKTGYIRYMGFLYPETAIRRVQDKKERRDKERVFNTAVVEGKEVELSALDFDYEIKGKASWRPEQVYNDGVKTFIRLPGRIPEMPVLLSKAAIVNYRIDKNTFVIDGLFDELTLILGVGSKQEKVTVIRSGI